MDTTWFAVDQDGFIAVMQSGEAGAVPCAVNQTEREEEVLTIVRKALSLGEPEPPDFASLIRSADQTDPVTNLQNVVFPGIRFAQKLSFQPAEYHSQRQRSLVLPHDRGKQLTQAGSIESFRGTTLRKLFLLTRHVLLYPARSIAQSLPFLHLAEASPSVNWSDRYNLEPC